MIKGEIQMSDAALILQPIQVNKNLETIVSEEKTISASIIEENASEKLNIKANYTRFKKRIRSRSSNIL